MPAVVAAKEMVRDGGAAERGGCACEDRWTPGLAAVVSAKEAENCGVGSGGPLRTLASGSRAAATSAATQTACRWLVGPRRMKRQTSAATAAASGICHSEFRMKVSREPLIVSILFLLRVLQQLLNLREFLRSQVTGFHQVQHQAIG